MKKIYVKNFKGFRNQVIELEDINFFVGENSTGKTSLINLITLLSSFEFSYNLSFNNDSIEMGYFEEIVSQTTQKNIKDFQVGFEQESGIKYLFCFKSEKSVPTLSWVKICNKNLNLLIRIKKTNFYYSYRIDREHLDITFQQWVKEEGKRIFGLEQKIDNNNSNKANGVPIIFLLYRIVKNILEKEELDTEDGNDLFPHNLSLIKNYTSLAPIRAKPKRIYESFNAKFSPEGDHIPTILKERFSTDGKGKYQSKIETIKKFGKKSNLFDDIDIKELGDKNTSPFEIHIKYNSNNIKMTNVGYGVSQILPLIIEILMGNDTTFSIQQPEVHLHPKAQAAFGEFMFESAITNKNKFMIETHSDFTINRYRHCLSINKEKLPSKSQILFFERTDKGNIVSKIEIDHKGKLTGNSSNLVRYKSFFISEELRLFEI